jgi:hypothetical protein
LGLATESIATTGSSVLEQLERDGVAVLPGFIEGEQLASMQRAFESRLKRLRWNDFDGYEKTERFRHMVQDVLTLDQGFVDVGLHPLVKETIGSYVGPRFELVEAKGWKSLPTRREFHGWHGDAWYDQTKTSEIKREVKLAFYLTDVVTGGFSYIKGTHRLQHPRIWKTDELKAFDPSKIVNFPGKAGTAFLFDTSGVHGQSSPILEPRHAVFYNYHDPAVPLQQEDVDYYRYHPLLLNAAFLGNLSAEDCRILGFGNKTCFVPAFERIPRHTAFQTWHARVFSAKILAEEFTSRVSAKFRRLLGA